MLSHAGAVCLPASCGSEQRREFYNVSVMFVSFLDGTESSEMRYGNDENDFWGCERWLMREATERNLKIEQIGKSKP